MSKTNLRYDMNVAAFDVNENRAPYIVMEELGITYTLAIPQTMAEQIWYYDCHNLPKKLPKYLTPIL